MAEFWPSPGVPRPHSVSWSPCGATTGVRRLLDILAARDIPATFRISGSIADRFPAVAMAAHNAGHEIVALLHKISSSRNSARGSNATTSSVRRHLRAKRHRYCNRDMADLKQQLRSAVDARRQLIVIDGVFSMAGSNAPLAEIYELADRFKALVMVDDTDAVGFVGPTGSGTREAARLQDRGNIVAGTLTGRLAETMVDNGVYVTAFGYPVVPRGATCIRVQLSAAHSAADLEACVAAFAKSRAALAFQ